jgi:hypothetical protein
MPESLPPGPISYPLLRLLFLAATGKCPIGPLSKFCLPNITHYLFIELGLLLSSQLRLIAQLLYANSWQSCLTLSPSLWLFHLLSHWGLLGYLLPIHCPFSVPSATTLLFSWIPRTFLCLSYTHTNVATPHYRSPSWLLDLPQSGPNMTFQAHIPLNSMAT